MSPPTLEQSGSSRQEWPRRAGRALLIGGANLNDVAYVNGEFMCVQDARVSILDRGFLFGDGVHEVAAVLEGKLIDYEAHLSRLERSLREAALRSPVPLADLREIQRELIARNGLREGLVYLQITRGAAAREFGFPKDVSPTLVMFTQEKNILAAPAARTGIAVKTVRDMAYHRSDRELRELRHQHGCGQGLPLWSASPNQSRGRLASLTGALDRQLLDCRNQEDVGESRECGIFPLPPKGTRPPLRLLHCDRCCSSGQGASEKSGSPKLDRHPFLLPLAVA